MRGGALSRFGQPMGRRNLPLSQVPKGIWQLEGGLH
jgi:hypothetical protein